MAVTQATQLADFTSGIGTAGAILEVDNVSNKIGIGTTNPQALLQVGQTIKMDGVTGVITATTFDGNFTGSVTGSATGLTGTPDITVNNIIGVGATFTGEVTYEDVTNIDSIGIITARSDISIADKIVHTGDTNTAIRFPSVDTFTVETAGTERLRVNSIGDVGLVGIATATGLVVVAGSGNYAGHAGVVTAVTFDGNLSGNVTGNADTATNASGLTGTPNIDCGTGSFTGDVDIADKIVHTGDTNTAIRFPSADTFTIETSGTERLRVGSTGTVGVAGLSTATSFGAFNHLSAPFGGGTVSYTVTVGSKTANHRYNGSGSSNGYLIDGVEAPFLTLTPGRTYRFVHDNTGSHPLKFYLEADKTTLYSTGVTFDNAYTEIVVSDTTPQVLHYQCTNHSLMGNAVQTNSNIGGGFNVVDESSDTSCNVLFTTDATGTALEAKTGTNLTFNSSSGALTATSFVGALTGNVTGNADTATNASGLTGTPNIDCGTGSFTGDVDIADKIIHTGDTNTAIRFPAADTFTVETAGSEALRITSNGDLMTGGITSGAGKVQVGGGLRIAGSATHTDTASPYLYRTSGADNLCIATNSVERLRITSGGLLRVPDNGKFTCGAGDDLQIYHDGSDSRIHNGTGTLVFRTGTNYVFYNSDGTEKHAQFLLNGEVELFYDGSKKFDTKSDGCEVIGELQCDSLDVDGAADITGNVTLHANLDLQDNDKILIGTGDDLEIYHDGSQSYIAGDDIRITNNAVSETIAKFLANGAVELNHNDSKKFETTSSGVTVTGNILPEANGTRDLGSSSYRFANLYTSDLDLSNEAKGGNEVDGTWGAYTIQEGEDDLFLLNRRNGKKYKFMLQEVN
jgi:hypothetical protein